MKKALEVFVFNYKMMDSKGNLIESSSEKPMSIIEGKQQVFKIVEQSLLKLQSGEKKRIALHSKDAFGEYNAELVVQIPKSKFNGNPNVGDFIDMELEDGSLLEMRLVEEKKEICILDGNHSLAGIDLLFEVEVLKRRPASIKEIKTGKAL